MEAWHDSRSRGGGGPGPALGLRRRFVVVTRRGAQEGGGWWRQPSCAAPAARAKYRPLRQTDSDSSSGRSRSSQGPAAGESPSY